VAASATISKADTTTTLMRLKGYPLLISPWGAGPASLHRLAAQSL
jgi:hypothetical protein